MVLKQLGILRTVLSLSSLAEVAISDCLETSVTMERFDWSTASSSSAWVQGLHLGEVVFGSFVVDLGVKCRWSFSLNVVNQVFVAATSSTIVVRHIIAFRIVVELKRWVQKLALEFSLLCIDDHFFSVLVRLELDALARVVWGVHWEFHAHGRCLQVLLIAFSLLLVVLAFTNGHELLASYRFARCRGPESLSMAFREVVATKAPDSWVWRCDALRRSRLGNRWAILGERYIDVVHLLPVLFTIVGSVLICHFGLGGANPAICLSHPVLGSLFQAEINPWLRLKCFVFVAVDAYREICSLGYGSGLSLLHGRLGGFGRTYRINAWWDDL